MASTDDEFACALVDIFTFEFADALQAPGCAACRTIASDERRWIDSFWREGKQSPAARREFFDGGGFCRRHAWLLYQLAARRGAGAAIADVYGGLAERDLQWLTKIAERLARGRRNTDARLLKRRKTCAACTWLRGAVERKFAFYVGALAEETLRVAYERSAGFCFPHLVTAVEEAVRNGDRALAHFLVADWRDRLAEVRRNLGEYDRKRDYRYAGEPKGDEQEAWTEVIRRYSGENVG